MQTRNGFRIPNGTRQAPLFRLAARAEARGSGGERSGTLGLLSVVSPPATTALALACVATVVLPAFAAEPIKITTDATRVIVSAGDEVIASYRYADVPFKPYVERFRTPQGINVLRDSPHDHKHHHALMFAVSVEGVNFWEEQQAPGRQQHRSLDDIRVDRRAGLDRAAFTEHIDWIDPRDGKLLVQERRTIEVFHAPELGASLLTWQSRLSVPPGRSSAQLTGSRYFGLGMRFLQSMDKEGRFANADGKAGVDGTNAARSAWCAYSAGAEGKPVTVAMFDDPGNARHPATWFTMDDPFAYLAATMNLDDEPFTLSADAPLVLRYGVALWDGHVPAERIAEVYRRWTALPRPSATAPATSSPDARR